MNKKLTVEQIRKNNTGMSVTERIKSTKQPIGGYLKPKQFEKISLSENNEIISRDNENVSPTLIGLTVDYLFRYLITNDLKGSFSISLRGADSIGDLKNAKNLLEKIKYFQVNWLDIDQNLINEAIISAIKLTSYDVCYRKGKQYYIPFDKQVNLTTIENIKKMLKNCLNFNQKYGPIKEFGFSFVGGYTDIISTGDGDFITEDTIWDIKVLNTEINNAYTLQILIYYLMGKHSQKDLFKNIKYLSFFNPRKNLVYQLEIDKLDKTIINEVEVKVIGY